MEIKYFYRAPSTAHDSRVRKEAHIILDNTFPFYRMFHYIYLIIQMPALCFGLLHFDMIFIIAKNYTLVSFHYHLFPRRLNQELLMF